MAMHQLHVFRNPAAPVDVMITNMVHAMYAPDDFPDTFKQGPADFMVGANVTWPRAHVGFRSREPISPDSPKPSAPPESPVKQPEAKRQRWRK